MTVNQLTELVSAHGLTINSFRQGAGKFRNLEIGVGADYGNLMLARNDLRDAGLLACILRVNNSEHEDFGKFYVLVESFWWD